jgi:hypothetical protein
MHQLIHNNPRNRERILPYLGGEELNDSPTLSNHRYVICFEEMSEKEAWRWPDLMNLVKEKVKPQRELVKRAHCRENWWQFEHWRKDLQRAIQPLPRTLVVAQTSNSLAFAFQPTNLVFAHTLIVLPFSTFSSFCCLQSRIHQIWCIVFAATMKDDFRYIPSDCFETFPFPENFETAAKLEAAGSQYYEFRAALMVKNNEGLTKTYNRFHDPGEISPDIQKLRTLHAAMDRTVLDAYGWTDLNPTCEFLLDFEEEDEEVEDRPASRGRKKPWRYRWPDDFRDTVLARLLQLNKERAEQERLSGQAADVSTKSASKRTRKTSKPENKQTRLPGI